MRRVTQRMTGIEVPTMIPTSAGVLSALQQAGKTRKKTQFYETQCVELNILMYFLLFFYLLWYFFNFCLMEKEWDTPFETLFLFILSEAEFLVIAAVFSTAVPTAVLGALLCVMEVAIRVSIADTQITFTTQRLM